MKARFVSLLFAGLVTLPVVTNCGGGDDATDGDVVGASGAAGTGGSAGGTAGTAGTAGTGGSKAGAGGTAGASGAGASGASGTSGTGGKGGTGGAGAAGASGSAGTGGSAGKGGASGAGGAGTGGSAGKGGCSTATDCPLPETNPANCVEAACTGGACVYQAKDADGDGFRKNKCKVISDAQVVIQLGNDCDDTNPKVNPKGWDGPAGEGHPNACNDGIDQDCSGTEGDNVLADGTSCACAVGDVGQCAVDSAGKPIDYPGGTPKGACKYGSRTCAVQSTTGSAAWGPCTGAVGPAVEECNGVDDDCDGTADEDAFDQKPYRCDQDADGHLDAKAKPLEFKSCTSPPVGVPVTGGTCNGVWVLTGVADDCNDADGTVFPGNTEACDGKDNNCNAMVDEDVTNVVWVLDADGDGFGAEGSQSTPSCAPPDANPAWKSGIPATDCDDTRKTVNQLGTEVCDGFDNNCAGGIDEGTTCDGTVTITPVDASALTVKLTQMTSKTGGSTDPYFDDYPLGIYESVGFSLVDENTVTLSQTLVESKTTSGGDSTVGKGTGTRQFTVDKPITAVLSGTGSGCTETVGVFSNLCKINEFPAAGTIGTPTGLSFFPTGEPYKIKYLCIAQSGFAPKGGVCTGGVTQCNSCDFTYSGSIRAKLKPYLPAPL